MIILCIFHKLSRHYVHFDKTDKNYQKSNPYLPKVIRNIVIQLIFHNFLQRGQRDFLQFLVMRVFQITQAGRMSLDILDEGRDHVGHVALEILDCVLGKK